MLALVLKEKSVLEMQEREKPQCGEGEALIRVNAVSVCGSDIHAYKGENALLQYPRVMGHEVCGTIEELKDTKGDSGFRAGDRVILMPYLNCGHCAACRKGKPNCCASLSVYGVHRDGAMAEYFTAPLTHILKVSPTMDPRKAAVIEPLAISTHAVRRAEVRESDKVLVVGAGPIGLGAAEIAGTYGAEVWIADTDPKRRRFVREKFGYEQVLDPLDPSYAETLRQLTNGDLPDKIIESTGNLKSMSFDISINSNGGRIVNVGFSGGKLSFDDVAFHLRETELLGSRAATKDDFQYVIDCIGQGKIFPEKFITHQSEFKDSKEAFDGWVALKGDVFKAVITMNDN